MREIEFRGKDFAGFWHHGLLTGISKDCAEIAEEISGHLICSMVLSETVGQYTGLTDKNGVKIFEGDIIKTHYANARKTDFVEQVVFHNGKFCSEYDKFWVALADGVPHLPQDKSVYMEWCEVIGNIHDNPELIEG